MNMRTGMAAVAALLLSVDGVRAQQDSAAQVQRAESQEARGELAEALAEAREEAAETTAEFREEIAEQEQERCEERCRQAGGAFQIQALFLDDRFLDYVKKYSSDEERPHLSLNDRMVLMIGGMTHATYPGDIRVGAGGYAGYKVYRSSAYDVSSVDSVTGDTTTHTVATTLRVIPALLGGVFEKNFQLGPVGIFGGTLLGGGVFVLVRQVSPAGDIFVDVDDEYDGSFDGGVSVAVAPCLVGDLHAGVTVRVAPGLHLGVEFMTLFTYAPEGFATGAAASDLFTASPSARLRLQFGRSAG